VSCRQAGHIHWGNSLLRTTWACSTHPSELSHNTAFIRKRIERLRFIQKAKRFWPLDEIKSSLISASGVPLRQPHVMGYST